MSLNRCSDIGANSGLGWSNKLYSESQLSSSKLRLRTKVILGGVLFCSKHGSSCVRWCYVLAADCYVVWWGKVGWRAFWWRGSVHSRVHGGLLWGMPQYRITGKEKLGVVTKKSAEFSLCLKMFHGLNAVTLHQGLGRKREGAGFKEIPDVWAS